MLGIANVTLPAWQAIFLILLSFGSLIIALYCLFFMVPLKKFVRRIESLGGGVEGLKNHLSGVETYVEKELQRIESLQADQLDSVKTDSEERLHVLREQVEQAQESLNRLKNTCDTLEVTAEDQQKKLADITGNNENIERRLKELQRDMNVVTEEAHGKVQKEVSKAFQELEATVLSTLEVLRDELLVARKSGDADGSRPPRFQPESHSEDQHREGEDMPGSKIISAGPLFSRSDPTTDTDEGGEEEGQDDEDSPDA